MIAVSDKIAVAPLCVLAAIPILVALSAMSILTFATRGGVGC